MIFDTHAHYDDTAFDADRESLLASFPERGIGALVNAASDYESLETTGALTAKYPFIYGAFGIHPSEIDTVPGVRIISDVEAGEGTSGLADGSGASGMPAEFPEKLRELLAAPKAVAVGEIGLDYHWHRENKRQQADWFIAQIEQARQMNLPVIIHSRDAAEDTLKIAKQVRLGEVGGVMHCYAYSKEHAREYLNMGIFLGIGGVITFKNAKKLREVVEYAPLSALVTETDCPYLAPEPHRGSRNTSLNLPLVVQMIAQVKGISAERVEEALWENALRLYRLEETVII